MVENIFHRYVNIGSSPIIATIKTIKESVYMIVKLKDFGTSLGARILGKEVSIIIDFDRKENITLDFQDVKMVTSSFADEVVGKNCARLGLHNFIDKVQIINTSEQIKLILKKAILDRLTEQGLNSH